MNDTSPVYGMIQCKMFASYKIVFVLPLNDITHMLYLIMFNTMKRYYFLTINLIFSSAHDFDNYINTNEMILRYLNEAFNIE